LEKKNIFIIGLGLWSVVCLKTTVDSRRRRQFGLLINQLDGFSREWQNCWAAEDFGGEAAPCAHSAKTLQVPIKLMEKRKRQKKKTKLKHIYIIWNNSPLPQTNRILFRSTKSYTYTIYKEDDEFLFLSYLLLIFMLMLEDYY
jgi:hypothetical protein